jgi:hypothetical protein
MAVESTAARFFLEQYTKYDPPGWSLLKGHPWGKLQPFLELCPLGVKLSPGGENPTCAPLLFYVYSREFSPLWVNNLRRIQSSTQGQGANFNLNLYLD